MSEDAGRFLDRDVTIVNERGLHARAAAKFVRLAEGFNATVEVEKNGAAVTGISIMGLMMLAAGKGAVIKLRARGPEARAALDALESLIRNKFDEET